jgi:hypothetical protein
MPTLSRKGLSYMNKNSKVLKRLSIFFNATSIIFMLGVMVACSMATEPTTLPMFTPVSTATQAAPVYTPSYKELALTEVAINDNNLRTAVALTAAPTWTWGPPRRWPTPTLILGIINGCTTTNASAGLCINAWHGVFNGQRVDVEAWREGRLGDPQQGFILVGVALQHFEKYVTPQRVGGVRITAVNGMQVTLDSTDSQFPLTTFTFDLATRQWVTPGPSPVPSLPPSPGP